MMPNRLCYSRLRHDTQAAANNFIICCSARRRHLIAHFFKNHDYWTATVREIPGHQLGHGKWGRTGGGMSHSFTHMLSVGTECLHAVTQGRSESVLARRRSADSRC